MNIPCEWHRVSKECYELRTSRGVTVAKLSRNVGVWLGHVVNGDDVVWESCTIEPTETLKLAKAMAEQMAARSVT